MRSAFFCLMGLAPMEVISKKSFDTVVIDNFGVRWSSKQKSFVNAQMEDVLRHQALADSVTKLIVCKIKEKTKDKKEENVTSSLNGYCLGHGRREKHLVTIQVHWLVSAAIRKTRKTFSDCVSQRSEKIRFLPGSLHTQKTTPSTFCQMTTLDSKSLTSTVNGSFVSNMTVLLSSSFTRQSIAFKALSTTGYIAWTTCRYREALLFLSTTEKCQDTRQLRDSLK